MEYTYIFAIISIIILCFIYNIYINSYASNKYIAPNKAYVNNTIDNSLYFQSLNTLDLIARGSVSSIAEYIALYKSKLLTFSSSESKILNQLITNISMNYTNLYLKLNAIPWKLVKFNNIENNFPHTLGDIIFLPESFFQLDAAKQLETLIHEKIHVYQRLYPIETSMFITKLGYEVWDTQKKYKNIRTNPDTNQFIYMNSQTGTVQAQVYNSDAPKSITDSHVERLVGDVPWDVPECIKQQDHPYEMMACGIANYIVNGNIDGSNYEKYISEWSREFL